MHAARKAIAKATQINDNIRFGWVEYDTLSPENTALVDEFKSRKLHRLRDECDAAFGLNNERRDGALTAVERLTIQVSPAPFHFV